MTKSKIRYQPHDHEGGAGLNMLKTNENLKIFLVCSVYTDGDGNSVDLPLKVFRDLEKAKQHCVEHYILENKALLFNEDESKKLVKVVLSVTNGVENVVVMERPSIYYEEYDLCVNDSDLFVSRHVTIEAGDSERLGSCSYCLYTITEMEVN